MQIVFGKENIEQLKEKYTVLELEEVTTPQGTLHPYCVVPVEQIALELSNIQSDIELHEKFVQAIKNNDVKLCIDLHEYLVGKFGGELDSFYDIVIQRCKSTNSTRLVLTDSTES